MQHAQPVWYPGVLLEAHRSGDLGRKKERLLDAHLSVNQRSSVGEAPIRLPGQEERKLVGHSSVWWPRQEERNTVGRTLVW